MLQSYSPLTEKSKPLSWIPAARHFRMNLCPAGFDARNMYAACWKNSLGSLNPAFVIISSQASCSGRRTLMKIRRLPMPSGNGFRPRFMNSEIISNRSAFCNLINGLSPLLLMIAEILQKFCAHINLFLNEIQRFFFVRTENVLHPHKN